MEEKTVGPAAGTPLDRQDASNLDVDDIRALNEAHIRYVASQGADALRERTAEVSVAGLGSKESFERAAAILDSFGIVIVPSFFDCDECDRIARSVEALHSRCRDRGVPFHEDEQVVYQAGAGRLKGYHQFSHCGKTVMHVRGGADNGMVDIFNCDLALPGELKPLRQAFESQEVLGALGRRGLTPRNLNVYINRGITQTRGFHVDSYSEQIKGFIYLTDVVRLEDGPYTFVKSTHRESAVRRANRKLCGDMKPPTEAPIVDPLAIMPALAPKGSLIISDQGGIHRGWPQGAAASRMVAVMNYR